MKREITCVVCPAGCRMTVVLDGAGKVLSVTGNTCVRGKTYAESEVTHPVRTLTTTVPIRLFKNEASAAKTVMLPVKTSRPIAKELLFEAMREIRTMSVEAPVKMGDVLAVDFMEPGVNLIACKSVL